MNLTTVAFNYAMANVLFPDPYYPDTQHKPWSLAVWCARVQRMPALRSTLQSMACWVVSLSHVGRSKTQADPSGSVCCLLGDKKAVENKISIPAAVHSSARNGASVPLLQLTPTNPATVAEQTKMHIGTPPPSAVRRRWRQLRNDKKKVN